MRIFHLLISVCVSAFFNTVFVCDGEITKMCAHVICVCVCVCCFNVPAPVCLKLFPNLIIAVFFFFPAKLHISPQAFSDVRKMMVVLCIWDMTVCD